MYNQKMINKNIYTRIVFVIIAAVIHTTAIKYFAYPGGIISGGFTGLGMLLERLLANTSINIDLSFWLIILNFPVAVICYRELSKKFVLLSLLEIATVSVLLKVLPEVDLINLSSPLLYSIFGGVINGAAISLALKANASTGGTDFIALFISNRKQKSIWRQVLIFNSIMYCIFGLLISWESSALSIVFQFASTRVIDNFYDRYKRITLQIITSKKAAVVRAYTSCCLHGLTVIDAHGGYSNKELALINTVVSSYEKDSLIKLVRSIDKNAVINVLDSVDFYGGFYIKPMD